MSRQEVKKPEAHGQKEWPRRKLQHLPHGAVNGAIPMELVLGEKLPCESTKSLALQKHQLSPGAKWVSVFYMQRILTLA